MLVDAHGPATADESWRRFTTPETWPTSTVVVAGVTPKARAGGT